MQSHYEKRGEELTGDAKDKCPECGSHVIGKDTELGETFCRKCGYVTDLHSVSLEPEWNSFVPGVDKGNVRATPVDGRYAGPATRIDGSDRNLKGGQLVMAHKLRKQNSMMGHSRKDRRILPAIYELDRLGDLLNVSQVTKDETIRIYRMAIDEDLIRGGTIKGFAAAALGVALKIQKSPKSLKDVIAKSEEPASMVRKDYRALIFMLTETEKRPLHMRPSARSPVEYLSKLASSSGASQRSALIARDILDYAKAAGITGGKDPAGLAVAAMYLGVKHNNEQVTQDKLAYAGNITSVTLRSRATEMERLLPIGDILKKYKTE